MPRRLIGHLFRIGDLRFPVQLKHVLLLSLHAFAHGYPPNSRPFTQPVVALASGSAGLQMSSPSQNSGSGHSVLSGVFEQKPVPPSHTSFVQVMPSLQSALDVQSSQVFGSPTT